MNELTVIERENQRVMTTAVLAEEYGTTNDVISKNFNRNKERYIEGKHYYCLEGDDLREFRANGQIDDLPMNLNKLYLWTEKGAFLHAKSLGTDRAWEVYDYLVDSYFKKVDTYGVPRTTAGQIQLLAQGHMELEQKIDSVNDDLQDFKRTMPLLAIECQQITDAKNRKVVSLLGGKNGKAYKNASLRGKVYRDLEGQLRREFDVRSYKAIHRNQTDKALEIINKYELPLFLWELVTEENAQVTFV